MAGAALSAALSRRPAARAAATALVVLVVFGAAFERARTALDRYASLEPLGLPGASRLRTDQQSVLAYHWLVDNLREHTDMFVGYPGLNSLYFWTRQNPPTTYNVGFWMGMLDAEKQRAIVAELSTHPEAGVVRNRVLLRFWSRYGPSTMCRWRPTSCATSRRSGPSATSSSWSAMSGRISSFGAGDGLGATRSAVGPRLAWADSLDAYCSPPAFLRQNVQPGRLSTDRGPSTH